MVKKASYEPFNNRKPGRADRDAAAHRLVPCPCSVGSTESNKQSKGYSMNINNIESTTSRTNSWHQRGFTLVELLLVLTILAILAAIVIPRFAGRPQDAKVAAAKMDIASFITALSMFEVDNGYLPKGADALQSLLVKPRDAQTWKGPYLQKDKIPLDPWGQPYVYEIPGRHYPTGYDLYSKGKDGQGGNDAIGNWTATAAR
jgi:general secretion pathway protein G